MKRLLTPGRLLAAGLVLLAVIGGVLWLTPSEKYIFLPDEADAVAPLVDVEGEVAAPDRGGIFYVSVVVRKATLLERIFPGLHDGSTLVPASAFRPHGVSDKARRKADRFQMARSQQVAAAVALRALGYRVESRSVGALISAVAPDAPAAGKLSSSDIVVAVDGEKVRTPDGLRRLISRREPGELVRLQVRDEQRLRTVVIRTKADPNNRARAIVGVLADEALQIELPLDVDIDIGNVGGPSAGLAFALDVMEELGRDVDRGYRVAATGQIELGGRVVPVGGLKQKTIGARAANVDVFLVPAGENATEARRYAGGLRIIPVQTFRQALRKLATLPRRA